MAQIKAYGKKELANLYGIGVNTLVYSWLKPFLPRLEELGYKKGQKLFTPAQIKFIFSDECIGEPLES